MNRRRMNVIGTSCLGKSTFYKALARALNIPHVELDNLNWEPGLIEVGPNEFRRRVLAAIAGDCWFIDGNYRIAREMIWPIADTVIWLDTSPAAQRPNQSASMTFLLRLNHDISVVVQHRDGGKHSWQKILKLKRRRRE